MMDKDKVQTIVNEKETIIGFLDFSVKDCVINKEVADELKQYLKWLAEHI
jgi:hypothetical protein